MRKVKVIATILFIISIYNGNAQRQKRNDDRLSNRKPIKHLLKIEPINLTFGSYGLLYEYVINSTLSINAYSIITFDDWEVVATGQKVGEGYFIDSGADIRYYFSKRKSAPRGFYLAGGILSQHQSINFDYENNSDRKIKRNFGSYGGRLLLGHQWIFRNRINLGVELGARYMPFRSKELTGSDWRPILNFTMGYSW
ncbi:DUF3575 domain-containing protein [Aquimarina sp. ERC-38]|uniref:DUF3575 domain-containing protein n=1 Tax=Aquimarina sp. ERC-38 TaxID=2949996 RepID=UPI0022468E36|nr:DUF3575 domain-containing protein [Aquimarina sp. ERC-38]UZO80854.1 DUF3575 domain-containing protein [Aquimarina sp. ERC-38]